jgi:hypothetical protein
MIEYAQSNDEGGDLMSPPEVRELVPEHLRSIAAQGNEEYPCCACGGDGTITDDDSDTCDCSHCNGTGIAGDE